MSGRFKILMLLLAACGGCIQEQQSQDPGPEVRSGLEIPYESFTLDNGLRVVVYSDHKTPIVSVGVWFHVGSRNEPEGKSGFAHLFEHLMASGMGMLSGEKERPLAGIGITGANAFTSQDSTIYLETVPTPALERILWAESRRLGNTMERVDQDYLDRQRDVVRNEALGRADTSSAAWLEAQMRGLYPAGHPYAHNIMGSMADLDAATLEDAQDWYKNFYGAANVVLVLSGDISLDDARLLATRYFGHITPGPALVRTESMVPLRTADTIDVVESLRPNVDIVRIWTVPGLADRDYPILDAAAMALTRGEKAPLRKRLVEAGIATRAVASVTPLELASQFTINATLKDPADEARAYAIVDEIMLDFLAHGPDREVLEDQKASKMLVQSQLLESVANVGRLLGEATLLADDPGHATFRIDRFYAATAEEIKAVAREWLGRPYYQMSIRPRRAFQAREQDPLSIEMPMIDGAVVIKPPAISDVLLENGFRIVLVERPGAPVLRSQILFGVDGSAAEASLTAALMMNGADNLSSEDVRSRLRQLGATLMVNGENNWITVSASMLNGNQDAGFDLLADVTRRTRIDTEALDLVRAAVSNFQQRRQAPTQSMLVMEEAIFGVPDQVSDADIADNISDITVDKLQAFYDLHVRPGNATMIVVGDSSNDSLLSSIKNAFGDWPASGAGPLERRSNVGTQSIATLEAPRIILVDNPGSAQTGIIAGHLAPASGHKDSFGFGVAAGIFGGRLMANLRGDKGWTYVASSGVPTVQESQLWRFSAYVQADKTLDAIDEMKMELDRIRSSEPVTELELAGALAAAVGGFAARFEYSASTLNAVAQSYREGRPLDSAFRLGERYAALSLDDLNRIVREKMTANALVWVIQGDLENIEAGVRALGLGNVEIWQRENGKP